MSCPLTYHEKTTLDNTSYLVYNPHPFPRGHNREYLGQKDNASGLDKLRHQTNELPEEEGVH